MDDCPINGRTWKAYRKRSSTDACFLLLSGTGYCSCNNCKESKTQYNPKKECPVEIKECHAIKESEWNETIREKCESTPCFDCWEVCYKRNQCFTMNTRRDPTIIGENTINIKNQYEEGLSWLLPGFLFYFPIRDDAEFRPYFHFESRYGWVFSTPATLLRLRKGKVLRNLRSGVR